MRWRYMTPQWHRSIFLLCFSSECVNEKGRDVVISFVMVALGGRLSSRMAIRLYFVLAERVFFPHSIQSAGAQWTFFSHCSESTYVKRATTIPSFFYGYDKMIVIVIIYTLR